MSRLGLFIVLFALPVWATLGEPLVKAPSKAMVRDRTSYSIHESVSDSGTLREYVSASGIVFAVAWQGLVHPDLSELLGSYYSDYQSSAEAQPRQPGMRQRQVAGARVVVEHWGHPRNLQGRAYDPGTLPTGVSINEIR